MGDTRKTGCCASDARAGGFTCLPNWLFGEATTKELALLLALQFHAPNIRPSLAALARESGLGKSTVCRTLAGLKDRGWLRTERQFTAEGRNCPTTYHLLLQRESDASALVVPERDTRQGAPDFAVPERDNRPMEAGGIVPEREGDCPGAGHEQEEENKKINPTALEPPLPPTGGELRPLAVATDPCRDRDGFLIRTAEQPAAEALPDPAPIPEPSPAAIEQPRQPQQPANPQATQPQPQQPRPKPLPQPAPDPEAMAPVKPKARKSRADRFEPTVDDVPAALLPISRELLAFWQCKGGKRTERAWVAQLNQLQEIQDDPGGGTDAARSQLEAGCRAAVFGKPWMAVTHANWQRFRRPTPIIGSGFGGKRTTMDRVMGAIALVEERERKAAAQQASRSELALAGVA